MVFFPDKVCFELRSPLFWEKPERRVINYSIFHNELAYTTDILKIAKTIDYVLKDLGCREIFSFDLSRFQRFLNV